LGLLLGALSLLALRPPLGVAQTRPAPALTPSPAAPSTRFAVYEDSAFTRAVRQGTRTREGKSGPRYWQQSAQYDIEARLRPSSHRLTGRATITYRNHSPDTLRRVAVHLRQNLFRGEAARRAGVPNTGGMTLKHVVVAGTDRTQKGTPGYRIDGTVAWIPLASPLPPNDSLSLSLEWSYTVPPAPADGRQGRADGVYFLGYWYPQFAVYDDVDGWVAAPYTGQAEFYMGWADYDVRLTVPQGWLVGATGRLLNADSVLAPHARRRRARARRTDTVVRVHSADADRSPTRGTDSTATWHFRAQQVRDMAWGTSPSYQWDATRAVVAPPNSPPAAPPDTVLIHSFYRPRPAAAAWPEAARHTRRAVETLSDQLGPYPDPTMTALEGVLQSGGMEYPMLTLMRPWRGDLRLAGDLMHEVAHTWVPMAVGPNEKRHPWLDEGLTQYATARAMRSRFGPGPRPRGRANDSFTGQRRTYLQVARRGYEVPLSTHGDDIPASLYFDLPYDKAAQVLRALRGVLGPAPFHRSIRAFLDRWWHKHPTPYDFFNTVADVTDRDLSWFWHTWFHTTATLDQALGPVRTQGDSTTITIINENRAVMPVRLALTRTSGTTRHRSLPATVWLDGRDTTRITVPATPRIRRIVIDPAHHFPDLDRSNQRWHRTP
jgi:hypothetical protein